MKLTAEAVQTIFFDCFLQKDEMGLDGKPLIEITKVEGVIKNFGFNPKKLKKHTNKIVEFLEQLPDTFRQSSGGGWSFLNACMDKHGNQWGEHINIEQLVVLGIGIDKVTYALPREIWAGLPGGMPYIIYLDK